MTFRGTTGCPKAAHWLQQPARRGTGEDKEREGKGRDACRGLRRDEVLRNFGARLHGTDELEKKFIGPAISKIIYYGEFDSGSERTLAAWIRHASRTEWLRSLSGARVSNT